MLPPKSSDQNFLLVATKFLSDDVLQKKEKKRTRGGEEKITHKF